MHSEYPNKIALDTNILMAISQFKIDLFQQIKQENPAIEIIIPSQVIKELHALEEDPKTKKHAKIALKSIANHKVKIQETKEKRADQALIKLSQDKIIIATNDKLLRKQIQEKGNKTAFIRKKKVLIIE